MGYYHSNKYELISTIKELENKLAQDDISKKEKIYILRSIRKYESLLENYKNT